MFELKVRMQIAAALVALVMVLSFSAAQAADTAKNVILMISDGWGYNQIQATNYWNGATLESYQKFPVQLGMSTYSASTPNIPGYDPTQAWSNFNYVKTGATDSASAATAMATGIKNYDGQINWYTNDSAMYGKTITEFANPYNKDSGKDSGVVSTVQWSHATPAAMFAHNASRNNYAAIANEMLGSTSPLKVIMGAGNPQYNDNGIKTVANYKDVTDSQARYVGGKDTWQALNTPKSTDWTLIQEKTDFEQLAAGTLVLSKVVGTFQTATTTQQGRGLNPLPAKDPDPNNPSGMAFNNNVPSLAIMSTGALNVLNQDKDGFFLMIEGGAVDWANHANQLGRLIEEQTDFNKAVDSVMQWVENNSNWNETLLIVTGDHETGFLWGPKSGEFNALVNNGPGVLPGASYNSGNHTNSLVPLFAKGAHADLFYDIVAGSDTFRGPYIDNTGVFSVMNSVVAPIPGSILLMSSGIIGMIIIGMRRSIA
jgi:alkaline phosphatase